MRNKGVSLLHEIEDKVHAEVLRIITDAGRAEHWTVAELKKLIVDVHNRL